MDTSASRYLEVVYEHWLDPAFSLWFWSCCYEFLGCLSTTSEVLLVWKLLRLEYFIFLIFTDATEIQKYSETSEGTALSVVLWRNNTLFETGLESLQYLGCFWYQHGSRKLFNSAPVTGLKQSCSHFKHFDFLQNWRVREQGDSCAVMEHRWRAQIWTPQPQRQTPLIGRGLVLEINYH